MNTRGKRLLAPVIPFESITVAKAKNDYLFTDDNRRILDVNSGQFCTVLGHSNQELAEEIYRIALEQQHTCTSVLSERVLQAAEKLNRISGSLDARSLLLSTGSEAVETCLRFGKHITGKDGVICFSNGYHGLTMGSQSITYSGVYARPLVPRIFSIEAPNAGDVEAEERSLNALKAIVTEHGHEIGLVLIEPVVSVGGLVYPSAAFLKSLERIAKEHDILFALDESQTGFGRVGKWFAYQLYDLNPDFVICSKGIGLGYPVAALLFSGSLVDNSTITMTHYSSHQNDSFGAGIICFGVDYIEKNDLLRGVTELGKSFLQALQEVEEECEWLSRARGLGLMLGIDFDIPEINNYRPVYRKFHSLMLEEGVLIQGTEGGRVLRFLPSYVITEEEIEMCATAMKSAFLRLKEERW